MDNKGTLEHEILGSVILNNNLMAEAMASGVTEEMFFNTKHQKLWKVFRTLQSKHSSIDIVTLSEALGSDLADIGGITYITNITSTVATITAFKDHIKIMVKRFQKRKINELGNYIKNEIEENEPDEVISSIQERTLDILKLSMNEVGDQTTRYENYIMHKYKVKFGEEEPAYTTGYKKLDERLGGIRKGNLVTIVSRSAVGKTTLAVNMAYKMAKKGIKTAFYSVEMTENELLDKINSSELQIDYKKISNVILSNEELHKVEAFTNTLLKIPLTIVQDATTTDELINSIMYKSLNGEIEVVFVDYLQLYCESSKGNTLSEKLGDLTISLKKIAQRNNIVIIALAQANREADSRVRENDPASYLLMKKDIQDSARIEQNSNIVLGISRNMNLDDEQARKELSDSKLLSYSRPDILVNPELMLVQVMKNRGGAVGNVALRYKGRFSKVEDFL